VPEERDRLGPVKDAAVGAAGHEALTFVERRLGKALDRDWSGSPISCTGPFTRFSDTSSI
jgi:hypothetical protein